MSKSADSSTRIVVLVAPEALEGLYDETQLQATLAQSPDAVRVLICLPQSPEQFLVSMLEGLGVEMQILLGPTVDAPHTSEKVLVVRALPAPSPDDQNEIALNLSDVLLVAASSKQRKKSRQSKLIKTAIDLKKPTIVPGEPLPNLRSVPGALDSLDPNLHAWSRRCVGRLEQWIMELLAFAWVGWTREGLCESDKKLRGCLGTSWNASAYFPKGWQTLAPDTAAVDSSKLVECFEAMDRTALHGSRIHRDLIWVAYLAAAFAVLLAVTGHLSEQIGWGFAEFIALVLVAIVVSQARRRVLQDRWTARRLGAEQLRIARMSLPLLVLPPALATTDERPAADGHRQDNQLDFVALAEVKRVVRDHGLPKLRTPLTAADAARWLHLIVDDQLKYHRNNHLKLEHAEKRLRGLTQALFGVAIAAVLLHLGHFFCEHAVAQILPFDARWLLLFTAAGPAFGAVFHGAATRLGIVHRVALSVEVERELARIDARLQKIINSPPPDAEAWPKVRALAYAAAETMGRENTSWHGLVRRYRDEIV